MKLRLPWFIRSRYYKLRFFKTIWNSYCAPWEWTDSILEIMFNAFEDFYNHSALDETIDWDSDEWHKKARQDMEDIHIFWTQTYKQRQEEGDELLSTWSEHVVHWDEEVDDSEFGKCYRWCSASNRYSEYLFELLDKHEALFEKEKESHLVLLVSIRRYLWT